MTGEQLLDTLQRIANEYAAIRQPCNCGLGEACSWCEIQFLLDEVIGDERRDTGNATSHP